MVRFMVEISAIAKVRCPCMVQVRVMIRFGHIKNHTVGPLQYADLYNTRTYLIIEIIIKYAFFEPKLKIKI